MTSNADEISVDLNFGVLKISTKWNPKDEEKKAAWELYVELVTRISVCPLGKTDGSDREALSSLYELFQSTRKILKSNGPEVAIPRQKDHITVAYLAIAFLNNGLRPFLSKWHPILDDYEKSRGADVSKIKHEQDWADHTAFRQELETLRVELSNYANCLADGAQVPRIAEQQQQEQSTKK